MLQTTFLLALAGASMAAPAVAPKIGVPASSLSSGKTFSVPAIHNPNYKPNGPAAYRKALLKYGKPVPEALNNKVLGKTNVAGVHIDASSDDGTVTATPSDNDVQYTCPVTLGGQTLRLDFDTGSSDLWVFSSSLPASTQSGHKIYNPSKSSTAKRLSGATWSIQYGDGSSASGVVYKDTVSVGQTVVTGQAVEIATKVSGSFKSDTDSDGLLGLALSSINTVQPQQQLTFSENAAPNLNSPLFTADLKHAESGSYDFGYIDSSKYTGTLKYTSIITDNGFWEFSANKYRVGSGKYHSDSATAIADTGTTLMLVSDAMVSAYYSQVSSANNDESQGGYTVDCDANLPSFTVSVGSNTFAVPGSLIAFAPIEDGSNTCFGGIQSIGEGSQYIYGDIFLKGVLAVFDLGNSRFGFATKAQ